MLSFQLQPVYTLGETRYNIFDKEEYIGAMYKNRGEDHWNLEYGQRTYSLSAPDCHGAMKEATENLLEIFQNQITTLTKWQESAKEESDIDSV